MNKEEFLSQLRAALAGLPQDDVEERIEFYSEMIDDRIEEGHTEEEAVGGIGSIDEIASQIVSDVPLAKIVKERVKPSRTLRAWEIVLIVLGAPIWFSLFVAAGAVVFSLYVTLWSLLLSLWAVEVSFVASSVASVAASVFYFVNALPTQGFVMLGAGLFIASMSIFLVFGCVAASKGIVKLTKKIALGIKSLFIRKDSSK